MTPLPLQHLQAFTVVARSRSFSAAARELGVSRSAVSQSVRLLEEQLGVVLFQRTTRSVALTDLGQQLLDGVGPAFAQAAATLQAITAHGGDVVGTLRLTLPRAAVPLVLEPVLPLFRARHPRVELERMCDDQLVDMVAGGFDAGIRLAEHIERDMVHTRLTPAFRFVVVPTPTYLATHGTPQEPDDLLEPEGITFRSATNGARYAWELERGAETWRLPVRGGIVLNDGLLCGPLARLGLGFAYVPEPWFLDDIRAGRLQVVLDDYAAHVPGYFVYFPTRAQRSMPLQAFIETARDVLLKTDA